MSIVIGIDVGISSTKIIGIESGKRIRSSMDSTASDPLTAAYGAIGKFLHKNDLTVNDVEHIMATGVGAKRLKTPILDIPTTPVDEFLANGRGARFDTGLDHMVVVSMGTGTSMVRVDGDDIRHIGGLGMGGGTLKGLAHLLLNTSDIATVAALAEDGETDKVNLKIEDVCDADIVNLTGDATASLFAKASQNNLTDNDLAAGLIHMVLETIGASAVLSQIDSGVKDFVLIGNIARLPQCREVFPALERLYNVNFHIPQYANYCTALGAALSYRYENE